MKLYLKISLSIASLILITYLGFIAFELSSQTGKESNKVSSSIAKSIENEVAEYFPVNHGDTFWRVTLNLILRKVGHFLGYMLIGAVICALLNILSRRITISALLTSIICPVIAYMDEYRQGFIPGRTPRWFDVKIDSSGAITGILIITAVFVLVRYVQKLRRHSLS
jgi:VanZ family protein